MASDKTAYKFRRSDNGKIVTVRMTFGELMERQDVLGCITLDDGTEAKRVLDETPGTDGGARPRGKAWSKPLASYSLGCHPSQIAEFREKARQAGLTGVDFTPDGKALLSTREQRKKYLRLRGLQDLDGGYSDG